ncbi:MAG: hypothetical protein LBP26_02615 [Clostridiales bacterium]|jgi:hypothetical protein|nr:hypothetical protein [Clostridiales bacterium]
MKFRTCNTVEITYGGKTLLAHNAVLNVKSALSQNLAYAKYVVMGGGGGGAAAAKTAVLTDVNASVTRGKLFARYTAALAPDECAGAEFSFFGLSADAQTLFNRADFPPLIKEEGKELSVSITVWIELSEGAAGRLFGGDNPLVRFLLGEKPLPDQIECVRGTCDALNAPHNRALAPSAYYPASAVFNSESLTLTAAVPASVPEVIITAGRVPVLRAFVRENRVGQTLYTAAVNADRTVSLPCADAASVVSVTGSDGTFYPDARLFHGAGRLFKTADKVSFNAGRGAEFSGDYLCEYAAVSMRNELMTMRADADGPKTSYRVVYGGGGFMTCAGGYLALFGDNLQIYGPDGAKTEYPAASGGAQNVIVNEGNVFHYVTASPGGKVCRYKIANGAVTLLDAAERGQGVKIFRAGFLIGIYGAGVCHLASAAGVNGPKSAALADVLDSCGEIESVTFGDDCALVKTAVGEFDKLVTFDGGDILEVAKAPVTVSRGGLFVIGGAVKRLAEFNRSTRALAIAPGDLDTPDIKDACALGRDLLVLTADGAVDTYYRSRNGAYLFCPNFTYPSTVQALVRPRAAFSGNVTASFTVSF